jgi:hypothetical protein
LKKQSDNRNDGKRRVFTDAPLSFCGNMRNNEDLKRDRVNLRTQGALRRHER